MNIHEVTERVRQLIEAEAGTSIHDEGLRPKPARVQRRCQPTYPSSTEHRTQRPGGLTGCALTLKTRSKRQYTLNGQRHKLVCSLEIIDNGPEFQRSMTSIFLPLGIMARGKWLRPLASQMILTRHGGVIQANSQPGHTCHTISANG